MFFKKENMIVNLEKIDDIVIINTNIYMNWNADHSLNCYCFEFKDEEECKYMYLELIRSIREKWSIFDVDYLLSLKDEETKFIVK